jgi:5-methylcytosine-specific restriction endonuclease McrA
MAISARQRFEILKRDNFTCRYCGRCRVSELDEHEFQRLSRLAANQEAMREMLLRQIGFKPDVVLEVDHVVPRSRGGTDDPDNLITSCQDCNRGKAGVPLDSN